MDSSTSGSGGPSIAGPGMVPSPEDFTTCETCAEAGYAWQPEKCLPSCLIADLGCATKPSICADLVPKDLSMYTTCFDCATAGHVWLKMMNKCAVSCGMFGECSGSATIEKC